MPEIDGPDGTTYDLPEEGEEVELTVTARVLNIDEADGRAPVVQYSFAPSADRLRGFEYSFYPWEADVDEPE